MKRTVIIFACVLMAAFSANAQLDGLLRAAKKGVQKGAEKAIEKKAEGLFNKAEKTVENELSQNKDGKTDQAVAAAKEKETYASLMAQVPSVPTVQQVINYKEAELNEQALRITTSAVGVFQLKTIGILAKAAELAAEGIDTTQLSDAAYKELERTTGLTRADIEKMSTMSEAEQEAYIQAHVQAGSTEAALLKEAEAVSKYLEPVQPIIDEWKKVEEMVDKLFAEADEKCRSIYTTYADRMAKAEGKARNKVVLAYYAEAVPVMREAVMKAIQIRQGQQLPIAEQIENEMVAIRAKHNEVSAYMINYPILTLQHYFTDINRLWELPSE